MLADDSQRLPARTHDPQAGGGHQRTRGEHSTRIQQVFAVVQHQQQLPLAQVAGQHLPHGPSRLVADVQGLGHRKVDQRAGR
jgi:hypothetical protein